MKRKIISILLAALFVCMGSVTASAEEKYPLYATEKLELNGSYLLLSMSEARRDGHRFWSIYDVGREMAGDVVIPAEYDGFPIERLYVDPYPLSNNTGFQYSDGVTSLTIPGSFSCLLDGAGYFSPSIKKLTVEEGVDDFGGTYFPGVTEAHLPMSLRTIDYFCLFWWHHDVTIYAPTYSAAQRYALDRKMKFVAEGDRPATITDVDEHWGKEDILWAWHNNILTGVSETVFSPNTPMTRGMLAAAFGRLRAAGRSMPSKSDPPLPYRDVTESDYYYEGCYYLWYNKAVLGKTADQFYPNDNITRQELAAILFRMVYDAKSSEENLQKFKDAGTIASWAREGMGWAVNEGILKGDGENRLNPKGSATRAEVASMLYRYQRYRELRALKETRYPDYPSNL